MLKFGDIFKRKESVLCFVMLDTDEFQNRMAHLAKTEYGSEDMSFENASERYRYLANKLFCFATFNYLNLLWRKAVEFYLLSYFNFSAISFNPFFPL